MISTVYVLVLLYLMAKVRGALISPFYCEAYNLLCFWKETYQPCNLLRSINLVISLEFERHAILIVTKML
jgi:hypothetical protein